jgi:hypothetical protein
MCKYCQRKQQAAGRNIMNHPLRWLYSQHVGTIITGPASCYLCGAFCPQDHTVTAGIADTFNSHYLARCPSSSWLCAACFWYLDGKSAHPEFRKMSLIVERNAWQNWQRESMKADIERWLHSGLEQDAYLVVSLSKKKHILLQAPLNAAGSHELAIQIEEQVAHVSHSSWQAIGQLFLELLALGHGKGEILSGNLYANTLHRHGKIAQALYSSLALERWRNSPQIELYSYVTIVEKEKSDSDGTGPGANVSAGARNQADRGGPPASRVERYRSRVLEQVSHGDLEDVRGKSGDSKPHHQQLDLFSLQALDDAASR